MVTGVGPSAPISTLDIARKPTVITSNLPVIARSGATRQSPSVWIGKLLRFSRNDDGMPPRNDRRRSKSPNRPVPRAKLSSQLELEHLARWIARQCGDKFHPPRQFVASQPIGREGS